MGPHAFDRATVDHLAALAALSLSDAEAERLARDLGAIVAYVEELSTVDTTFVSTETEAAGGAWREDVVHEGLSHDDALAGAPRATEVGFAVPAFVTTAASGAGGGGR